MSKDFVKFCEISTSKLLGADNDYAYGYSRKRDCGTRRLEKRKFRKSLQAIQLLYTEYVFH